MKWTKKPYITIPTAFLHRGEINKRSQDYSFSIFVSLGNGIERYLISSHWLTQQRY